MVESQDQALNKENNRRMKKLTIFTAPKPFTDPHIDLIQRNAIRSWLELGEGVDIILVGDEQGLAEVAREYQVTHLPDVKKNEWGTPRVDSIFHLARKANRNELLAYLNADIILLPDFMETVWKVREMERLFLLVGRRWDLRVEDEIRFHDHWGEELFQEVKRKGKLHGPTAMDYFVFPRDIFIDVPPFAIGRAGWDNWMIYHARQQGWPVIDATPSLTVIHQAHDYSHLPEGRPHYDLEESHRNVSLGGGFDKVYDLLDVERQFCKGRIRNVPFTLPRFLRKFERWVMPDQREGWRWQLTRLFRKLRRMVS